MILGEGGEDSLQLFFIEIKPWQSNSQTAVPWLTKSFLVIHNIKDLWHVWFFFLTKLMEDWCSNVNPLFTQVNVEQKKGFPIQEEPDVTTSGNLRKSIQITESKKDCLEEENKLASIAESAFLISDKRSLLKRKGCSEEVRNAEVPCKLMKKGMLNCTQNKFHDMQSEFLLTQNLRGSKLHFDFHTFSLV